MLAKSVKEIPAGPFSYEPKWDGFRSIVFRDGDEVEIGSRNEQPMTRYFPEVVEAVRANLPERASSTARSSSPTPSGPARLRGAAAAHPPRRQPRADAGRGRRPAHFVAFDLLALGDDDLTRRPFAERRAALEEALADARPPIHLTPATTDVRGRAAVVRGVRGRRARRGRRQAARRDLPAGQAGDVQDQARAHRRLRRRRLPGAQERRPTPIGSLLLGLYDDDGRARVRRGDRRVPDGPPPRAVRRSCSRWSRRSTATRGTGPQEMAEARTPRSAEGSRWNAGKDLSFAPLRPERVVEVRYDHMEGVRFRHTAPVRPVAPRPRPAVVHLRAARGAGELRPRRRPRHCTSRVMTLRSGVEGSRP